MTKYKINYSINLKAETNNKSSVADMGRNEEPIYKSVIAEYMYKPFLGFPRNQPLTILRELAKNVYVSSVYKSISDTIIDTDFNIVTKEGVKMTPELQEKAILYKKFFQRPNPEDSFSTFIKKLIPDMFTYDSGVINKVFNPLGEMIQLRPVAGYTFKKNPDKYGYLDTREELILNKSNVSGIPNIGQDSQEIAFSFQTEYSDIAAYYQFIANTSSQIPIPFGKREICWITLNPTTETCYSRHSHLEDCIDLVLSLVYGLKYNLDFYANGNTPEGIINAVGANKKDLIRIKEQLTQSVYSPKDNLGFKRRIGYRMPVVNMEKLDFIKLNLSSAEMEILNQQQWFTKILWMRFGLNADELGFTENSNRSTSTQQTKNAIRKGASPMYNALSECFTNEILPEFDDGELFRFEFDFYDPVEQKSLRDLQEQEIRMGINSWQSIADKEGLNISELKKHKEENQSKQNAFTPIDSFRPLNANSKDKEIPQQTKNEINLEKEKANPSIKSLTTEPKELKKIIKRGSNWCILQGDNTLSCHKSKEEAIKQLKLIDSSNTKGKKEDKKGKEKDEKDEDIEKDDDEEPFEVEDDTQKKFMLESPIEKVMKKFMVEIEDKVKSLETKAGK